MGSHKTTWTQPEKLDSKSDRNPATLKPFTTTTHFRSRTFEKTSTDNNKYNIENN